MEKSENQYRLRISDFIPVKGFFNYADRVDSPPTIRIGEDLKNIGKGLFLGVYNLALIGSLAFGGWRGLEFLLKN